MQYPGRLNSVEAPFLYDGPRRRSLGLLEALKGMIPI